MKERYDALLAKIHDRKDEVNRFINMLHSETTWLTSPASTKYHLNKEGGLLEE
jgi:23S rRNA maturation-related 3'-5' exoribonuclease YhaM